MSTWPSSKGRKVYRALLRIGWKHKPLKTGGTSHNQLIHPNYPDYTWSFGDGDELGPAMLARIAKHTGLKPTDL